MNDAAKTDVEANLIHSLNSDGKSLKEVSRLSLVIDEIFRLRSTADRKTVYSIHQMFLQRSA